MERGRMNQQDEKTLQSNIIYLKDNVNFDDIQDYLLQEGVISFDQKKDLKEERNSNRDKIDKLLHILLFAGLNSFKKFLVCLEKSGYGHVASHLNSESNRYGTKSDGTEHCASENKDATETVESEINRHGTFNSDRGPGSTKMKEILNTADGPIKSSKDADEPTGTVDEEAPYDEVTTDTADIESNYDTALFPDMTGLNLRIPFTDNEIRDSQATYDDIHAAELNSVPGWCPRINDSNHDRIVRSLKDGDFFIWFSKQKDSFIITLRTEQHKDERIYVKVKTRNEGSDVLYRITREYEDRSLPSLFKHYIAKGLPLKFIQK